mmetsp:Transcript_27753/g.58947  ORF Transcript_27753/g.58947 Transcript_27753/m.58947 type:complete len:340 (+) Transcript_27753:39-1058(+)
MQHAYYVETSHDGGRADRVPRIGEKIARAKLPLAFLRLLLLLDALLLLLLRLSVPGRPRLVPRVGREGRSARFRLLRRAPPLLGPSLLLDPFVLLGRGRRDRVDLPPVRALPLLAAFPFDDDLGAAPTVPFHARPRLLLQARELAPRLGPLPLPLRPPLRAHPEAGAPRGLEQLLVRVGLDDDGGGGILFGFPSGFLFRFLVFSVAPLGLFLLLQPRQRPSHAVLPPDVPDFLGHLLLPSEPHLVLPLFYFDVVLHPVPSLPEAGALRPPHLFELTLRERLLGGEEGGRVGGRRLVEDGAHFGLQLLAADVRVGHVCSVRGLVAGAKIAKRYEVSTAAN